MENYDDPRRRSGGGVADPHAHEYWRDDPRGGWHGDLNRRTTAEERERGFVPREQFAREHALDANDARSDGLRDGPHSGRGPKNYRRSDERIVEEASSRLERDGYVDASDIEVTAEAGVLFLRGTVTDRQTKRRAENCVDSVHGVRDVMNELQVTRSQAGRTDDLPTAQHGDESGRAEKRH